MWQRIITYFKEARSEFAKVNWPTRRQTINYTLVVIGFSLAMATFLGALDALYAFLIQRVLGR
ncbi:preprotein translocase subunit SecE [Candidatus Parcubacteria bacterium]|nr:preprotein translocase subunit SecE [Candidatus Parcubacteria bacterium]